MSYASIDTLQNSLSEQVFAHTKDSKKAAGRALGTMIEIISYYLLRHWGLADSISIERGLAEYGNPNITHNVEFSLHPIIKSFSTEISKSYPISANKILRNLPIQNNYQKKNNVLLDRNLTLKNACIIAERENELITSTVIDSTEDNILIKIFTLNKHPYAMFECKRVGVEEGNKKGPQTIEKAKQGAYVALNTSSLQKIRNDNGEHIGILYQNGTPIIKPYADLLKTIINSDEISLLTDFTLSVGIVSNHGNWFTSENQNKELKVLSQSYDWLLFLSDEGLCQFITELITNPLPEYRPIQNAFLSSYKNGKKFNCFTKVKMNYEAHNALSLYFAQNISTIENWFNIITPNNKTISDLKQDLYILKNKNWEAIL